MTIINETPKTFEGSWCQQVHKIEEKAGLLQGNYNISEHIAHVENKNKPVTCITTIENKQPIQQDFRHSSDNISSEISIEHSAIYSFDSVSPAEWNIEDVVIWLESVGLDMVVDNFIDHEITGDILLHLDEQALKDIGISALGRRRKIINLLNVLKASLNNTQSTFSNISLADRAERLSDYSQSENKNDSSSLKLSVSSSRLDDQIQYKPYSNCRGESSIDNCCSTRSGEERKARLLLIDQFSAVKFFNNSTTTFDNARFSPTDTKFSKTNNFSTLLNTAPPSPPASLSNMEVEQSASDTHSRHEGWLFKQSSRFKTWNKRWFVLHDNKLYYFKNSKDMKVKGFIHLEGYRVYLDPPGLSTKKRHGFSLIHDNQRAFYFHTNTSSEMKKWVQMLIKSNIKRNFEVPVLSSNTSSTVALDIAQLMKPRPPSILMYSKNEYNKLNQRYRESIMRDVLNSTLEEELDETLLWIEHPYYEGHSFEKLIIHSCRSSGESHISKEDNTRNRF